MNAVVARLSQVVTHRPEHECDLLWVGQPAHPRGGLVYHQEVVNPDVSLRVPLGLLLAPNEGGQTREQPFDDSQLQGQLEAGRRSRRPEQ